MEKIFLFQKDFSERGKDRYFIWHDDDLIERDATEIAAETAHLICHDYWLIAPALYKSARSLPLSVVDIFELSVAVSGLRATRKLRERQEIKGLFSESDAPHDDIRDYLDIFYRSKEYDAKVYRKIAAHIRQKWERAKEDAEKSGELHRQMNIEIPVFNALYRNVMPGIAIDLAALKMHKEMIEHEFYLCLKNFSNKHNFPLEVPTDSSIIEYLQPKGFDFSGMSVEQILKFVPVENDFADDVLYLRKLNSSRDILMALPSSKRYTVPVIDVFGSITSRIYFKDPVFQNLSRKHRDIIISAPGKKLAYVDYDQFEVGIMAALSKDPILAELYATGDLYSNLAERFFNGVESRKFAKQLFLSYAYGMKLQQIYDAGAKKGADRAKLKDFFKSLTAFEAWKLVIQENFLNQGRVGTAEGNFLKRTETGPLTDKEKRSCISQVVQGTASLIFKKTIIEVDKEISARILIPMHDALLVEHTEGYDPKKLIDIFSAVMTIHFNGEIAGKASLELFFK